MLVNFNYIMSFVSILLKCFTKLLFNIFQHRITKIKLQHAYTSLEVFSAIYIKKQALLV